MAEVLKASKNHYDYIFITDVRFYNECAFIKEQGGSIVRVQRRLDVVQPSDESDYDNHSSEINLDDYPEYDLSLIHI